MLDEVAGLRRRPWPLHGLAPGAYVMEYKVCGPQGCYACRLGRGRAAGDPRRRRRDQLLDLGWHQPVHRPGRAGLPRRLCRRSVRVRFGRATKVPGRGRPTTCRRGSPRWRRRPRPASSTTTLTLTASNGDDRSSADGASITVGVDHATPVVLAQNVPGYTDGAAWPRVPSNPAIFDGHDRRLPRERPGPGLEGLQRLLQGGGEGMVLYNPARDRSPRRATTHWVPTIHLARTAPSFLAFMAAHTGAMATISPPAQQRDGQGDVMVGFSSRGPGGQLHQARRHRAGRADPRRRHTVPGGADPVAAARPARLFQAIAGTSMSSPHVAGAGLLFEASTRTGIRARSSRP